MRRILVIGNSGGGKSTLARRLGEKLGLPVIHLDVLFWKPGWVESERDDYLARVMAALAAPAWICDGQFTASFHLRMPLADTIVWIDQPPALCLVRAIWRAVTYRDGGRPDMADGCTEKVDFEAELRKFSSSRSNDDAKFLKEFARSFISRRSASAESFTSLQPRDKNENGVVIVAHGRSTTRGLVSAIRTAHHAAEVRLPELLKDAIPARDHSTSEPADTTMASIP